MQSRSRSDALTVSSSNYSPLSDSTELCIPHIVNEEFCLGSAFWLKRTCEPKHAAVWKCLQCTDFTSHTLLVLACKNMAAC